MPLAYRCLILDHDDTAVDSSATVHHPSHVASMAEMRPSEPVVTLEEWFLRNFDPGIMAFLTEEVGLSGEELAREEAIWRSYTSRVTPSFYPGFLEALVAFRRQRGLITVVSHSEETTIRRHYGDFVPDLVFGWTDVAERRKPCPWPVQQILERFSLRPEQVLVVDDLKPGVDMAQRAGVPVAAAGWGHRIPAIEAYMRANTIAYLETVEQFARLILGR